jgi:hypothetical protein
MDASQFQMDEDNRSRFAFKNAQRITGVFIGPSDKTASSGDFEAARTT